MDGHSLTDCGPADEHRGNSVSAPVDGSGSAVRSSGRDQVPHLATTRILHRYGQRAVRTVLADGKKAYGFRSKVAHGAWKKNKDSIALTATSEAFPHRALMNVVMDDSTQYSLGKDEHREVFLDEQMFI